MPGALAFLQGPTIYCQISQSVFPCVTTGQERGGYLSGILTEKIRTRRGVPYASHYPDHIGLVPTRHPCASATRSNLQKSRLT